MTGSFHSENRCLIIGEVAQAHEGSVGMAHAFIDAVAKTGADGVKFQTHIADAESTCDEPWRVQFSTQDATRLDYWKRMEFTEVQWHELRQHAKDRGLLFLSSPFSFEAIYLLRRVGVDIWKVASGEISNAPLLETMLSDRIPIWLSSGMSHFEEIDRAVDRIKKQNVPIAILQSTSEYPCPPEKIGLNVLSLFKERYQCAVGLSDHSGTMYPGLAAATLGATIIEVHVTLSRDMFGPDVTSSITTTELRQLVNGVRCIEKMIHNPVDKDVLSEETVAMRELFTQSIVAAKDLEAGIVLQEGHLTVKKPGKGIPAARFYEVIGKTITRAVNAGEFVQSEDLDGPL